MTTEALAVIDVGAEMVVKRPPEVVLEEAQKAAKALKTVLDGKPDKVLFNGHQYLEFEDWQTVGRFYGVTAKVLRTEYVTFGTVAGFMAYAVALRPDGFELSAAEAMCLNDEAKWRSKPRYEWQENPQTHRRERVQVGEEPVPLFQLKSMAQTRACAKALRNVLAWVVVLAGYKATPAEELEAERAGAHEGAKAAPAPAAAATTPAPPAGTLTVTHVSVKKGTYAKGKRKGEEYTNYRATFSDGRKAGTFDDTLGQALQAAEKSGAPVNPELVQDGEYLNVKALLPLQPPAQEASLLPPDEPVTGPEKILTVRKVETDSGPRWVIQTDKRVLVTDQEKHADGAVAARAGKVGIVPTFEAVPGKVAGGPAVNKLISFTVETPVAAREPGEEG